RTASHPPVALTAAHLEVWTWWPPGATATKASQAGSKTSWVTRTVGSDGAGRLRSTEIAIEEVPCLFGGGVGNGGVDHDPGQFPQRGAEGIVRGWSTGELADHPLFGGVLALVT